MSPPDKQNSIPAPEVIKREKQYQDAMETVRENFHPERNLPPEMLEVLKRKELPVNEKLKLVTLHSLAADVPDLAERMRDAFNRIKEKNSILKKTTFDGKRVTFTVETKTERGLIAGAVYIDTNPAIGASLDKTFAVCEEAEKVMNAYAKPETFNGYIGDKAQHEIFHALNDKERKAMQEAMTIMPAMGMSKDGAAFLQSLLASAERKIEGRVRQSAEKEIERVWGSTLPEKIRHELKKISVQFEQYWEKTLSGIPALFSPPPEPRAAEKPAPSSSSHPR